jgi:hypothetical protein
MAIPSRQIGWSQKANLLWQISKQLEKLTQVAGNVVLTTTTTSTSTSTTTTTTTQAGYTIGQVALGGVIAYILQPGDPGYDAGVQHGLVTTLASAELFAAWGCQGTLITGADGTAIGTGNQNTIDIMADCATPGIAARLCGNLNTGGYSDWYLPSQNELNALYTNRVAIGGFQNDNYFSSTESDGDYAFGQSFIDGSQTTFEKDLPLYVRAIRSF